jgi:membrane protease YdiL (CAAX protease family)
MAEEIANDQKYRLKPTLLNALIIVVAYVVFLSLLQKLFGVPYTDIAKSSTNMLYGVLIPVVIGSMVLTITALWSGWWKDLWRDKYHIKDHAWMHIFLIIVVIQIMANFFSGNISSLDAQFIIYTFIGTAFVGYSEELLARGLLVRGARGSGFSEVKVFLIVILVFGCIHGVNIINGQSVVTTLGQIVTAGLTGGVFYTVFRKSGFLAAPMALHCLYDFSIFTQGTTQINATTLLTLAAAGIMGLSYILLIFAARNFNVKKIEENKAS